MTQTLPFGSWPSPITADDVASGSPRIDGARFVDGEVWWSAGVPQEKGRTAVFRPGAAGPVLPAPWSVRSRVHEYGGGAWTVHDDGSLLFVEHSDQRIWRSVAGAEPVPLTPAAGEMRFGELTWAGGRLWAVRETHTGSRVPARDIVVIPIDGGGADGASTLLSVASGSDFVASPSPHGDRLAWIAWDHPDMPWDATELRVGRLGADGTVVESRAVAGGCGGTAGGTDVSVLQPEWTGDDELTFSADPSGRWNLYRITLDGIDATGAPVALSPADADTGGALWNLGARWFAPLDDGRIVAVRTEGRDRLTLIDPSQGSATDLAVPVTGQTLVRDRHGTRILVTGSGVRVPAGLWEIDVESGTVRTVAGGVSPIAQEWLPEARAVSFEGTDGTVHAFDYPPTNPDASGPEGDLPPYLLLVHGGPTSHVSGDASLPIAYLTSRGIGVLDVNYGGSTGYGRAYRERLDGRWGLTDVDDVVAAARGLAAAGEVDPARIAIKGGSAGGWTVLCAVAASDVFGAGISRYGVADLRRLATDTHDFEARYLDGLVGPLPDAETIYVERSPLSRPESLRTPLLILQGSEDPIVPPSQSEAVRDALAANSVPHAFVLYEGESHGFRRAETITHALETELAFLGAVFGFLPAGGTPLELS